MQPLQSAKHLQAAAVILWTQVYKWRVRTQYHLTNPLTGLLMECTTAREVRSEDS
jgi:hypothetical protein